MEDCLRDIERALGRVGSHRKSFRSEAFDTKAILAAKLIQTHWRRRQVNLIMRKETENSVATFKSRSKAIRERQVSQRDGDAEAFSSKLMQLLFEQTRHALDINRELGTLKLHEIKERCERKREDLRIKRELAAATEAVQSREHEFMSVLKLMGTMRSIVKRDKKRKEVAKRHLEVLIAEHKHELALMRRQLEGRDATIASLEKAVNESQDRCDLAATKLKRKEKECSDLQSKSALNAKAVVQLRKRINLLEDKLQVSELMRREMEDRFASLARPSTALCGKIASVLDRQRYGSSSEGLGGDSDQRGRGPAGDNCQRKGGRGERSEGETQIRGGRSEEQSGQRDRPPVVLVGKYRMASTVLEPTVQTLIENITTAAKVCVRQSFASSQRRRSTSGGTNGRAIVDVVQVVVDAVLKDLSEGEQGMGRINSAAYIRTVQYSVDLHIIFFLTTLSCGISKTPT